MDRIIKEELLRCAGTFFYALLFAIGLVVYFKVLPASVWTVLGIPLLITGIVFSIFVYKRKTTGKEYKFMPDTAPFNILMVVFMLAGVGFIVVGIGHFYSNNIVFGLFFICLGIFSIVAGIKELRKK